MLIRCFRRKRYQEECSNNTGTENEQPKKEHVQCLPNFSPRDMKCVVLFFFRFLRRCLRLIVIKTLLDRKCVFVKIVIIGVVVGTDRVFTLFRRATPLLELFKIQERNHVSEPLRDNCVLVLVINSERHDRNNTGQSTQNQHQRQKVAQEGHGLGSPR